MLLRSCNAYISEQNVPFVAFFFPNAQSVQKTAHVHCAIHSLSALSAVLSPRVLNSTLKREAGAI